jgi:glycosyltransferase involved in cell wall biosynthesis
VKILHVQRIESFAGSEKYILELSSELKKHQVSSEVLCIYHSNHEKNVQAYIKILENQGIRCFYIVSDKNITWRLIKEIKKIIIDGNYDLIQTHLIYADIYLALVKTITRAKIVCLSTKHGFSEAYYEKNGFSQPFIPYTSIYYYMALIVEKFIDHSFAVSHGIAKVYKYLGITKKVIPVVHHGLRANEIEVQVKTEKRFSKYQVLVVGRLAPLKGQAYVIEALEYLLCNFSKEIKLVLVGGDSGYEEQLKRIVDEKGLSEYVLFEGFQKNVEQYYLASDVVVVPSKAEAFGFVFLEAFNYQKSVVAFDVPAGNEIIINNKNGFLIEPFNIQELAEKIQLILESPKLKKSFEKKGYEILLQNFSIENMTKKTLKLYNQILNND